MTAPSRTRKASRQRSRALRDRGRGGGVALPAQAQRATVSARSPVVAARTPARLREVGTEVAGALDRAPPTFGNILSSIGLGVANSQASLDKGFIDTVNALADTKITVISEVIQHLDDDGLPGLPEDASDVNAESTELIQQELSVLNFVTPTVHEWKQVVLAMDLSVSGMDEETGLRS